MVGPSVGNEDGRLHKMYSKLQTRQKDRHDYPSDYGEPRSKYSRGKHFSKKCGANSDKCRGCGGIIRGRNNVQQREGNATNVDAKIIS